MSNRARNDLALLAGDPVDPARDTPRATARGPVDSALQRQRTLAELAVELRSDRPVDELLQLVTARGRELMGVEVRVSTHPDGSCTDLVRERDRVVVPLLARDGSSLGAIEASATRTLTARDEAVLVQVAHMAAAALEDARLRAELEDRVRELGASLAALRRMHEERRRLIRQLVAVQEEERARLAKELHDDPVQIMTAASMRLEIVRRHLGPDELPAFERLQHTVTEAIARLRRMMFELRPISLDDGLESALNHYLYQHELVQTGTVRNLSANEPSPDARTILYRVAQEALANIRKHAEGARFEIVHSERDGGHQLEIRDEGPGFDPAEVEGRALGIASMRERTELAGGWFVIHSARGEGTALRAWIPSSVGLGAG